jgi:DNA-damage-inducible protein J
MVVASPKETTSIKLDKEIKEEAKKVFQSLGMTMSEPINIFLHQVTMHKGLPFEVKIPNQETQKAIEEARQGINMEETSLEEMMMEHKKSNA